MESEFNFSIKLLLNLNATEESTVFSSSSLLQALSMIYLGSKNNTAVQIENVIGKDKSQEEIIEYYSSKLINAGKKTTTEGIKTRKRKQQHDEEKEEATIKVANKIFVSEACELLPSFQQIMKKKFGSVIEKLDFENTVESAKKINKFVSDSTNNTINEIITPPEIDVSTSVALINAVYFLGSWENPFKDRQKQNFYSTKTTRKIDMMKGKPGEDNWILHNDEEWTALGIPYKGRKAWFFIVLPKENSGLDAMLGKLDFEAFKKITTKRYSGKVDATIPVFTTETSIDLVEHLKKFGISDAFDEKCDLSSMIEGEGKIGKATHKAIIKVDEHGTEASAATAFYRQSVSARSNTFVADHPFLYFIASFDSKESFALNNLLFIGTFC